MMFLKLIESLKWFVFEVTLLKEIDGCLLLEEDPLEIAVKIYPYFHFSDSRFQAR
jgi:hypothetical protein